jgi:hypothetical protein
MTAGLRSPHSHTRPRQLFYPLAPLGAGLGMQNHLAASTLGIALVLTVLAAPLGVPPAEAQAPPDVPSGFQRCGDPNLVLVFMNPDLQAADDGRIHASGTFFIQFQARGEVALSIETFTFHFGVPLPGKPVNCDTPLWVTAGALIKDYRCDPEPRDGFFVPIDTYNVPDGEYVAGVSAWDANGNELVRYWATAVVENGGRQTPMDPRDRPDRIAPWPMILPGDGERLDGGQGLYIEVAEPISDIQAWLNGARLELTEGTAPARDDDLVPCTQAGEGQVRNKAWGPVYTWDGAIGPEDVVRVRVVDYWGNIAEKVVHIGDPTIGGRVVGGTPQVEIEVDSATKESDANGTAVFQVTYRTMSDTGLHGDLFLRARDGSPLPEGLEARLRPNHVMMGGNEQLRGTVTLTGTNASLGRYDLRLTVDYLSGAQRLQEGVDLTFHLTSTGEVQDDVANKQGVAPERTRGEDLDAASAPEPEPEQEAPRNTPGPELLAVLVAAGAALLLRRRR